MLSPFNKLRQASTRLIPHLKHKAPLLDLSYGKENVCISLVNTVDNNYSEYVEYSTERIPREKVFLNLDKDFLVGCDCDDDCQDKDRLVFSWSL